MVVTFLRPLGTKSRTPAASGAHFMAGEGPLVIRSHITLTTRKPLSTGTTQTDGALCFSGFNPFHGCRTLCLSPGLQALPRHRLWINLSPSLSHLVLCLEPHLHLAHKLLPILQNPSVTGSALISSCIFSLLSSINYFY